MTRFEFMMSFKMPTYVVSEDFKPCPFCGGTPLLGSADKFYSLQGQYGKAVLTVECPECKVEMCEHSHEIKNYEERVALLRERWNSRMEASKLVSMADRYCSHNGKGANWDD